MIIARYGRANRSTRSAVSRPTRLSPSSSLRRIERIMLQLLDAIAPIGCPTDSPPAPYSPTLGLATDNLADRRYFPGSGACSPTAQRDGSRGGAALAGDTVSGSRVGSGGYSPRPTRSRMRRTWAARSAASCSAKSATRRPRAAP